MTKGLPDVRYADWAHTLGLTGARVDRADDVDAVWDRALADRPFVIDAVVDPAELMIPPHFTLEQARNTAQRVLRGDSDALGIVKRGLPAVAATFLPHKSD